MKKFEIGKTYTTHSICNSDRIISITVTTRSACMITTVDEHGKAQRLRISKRISEYRNAETVYPWGQYSMAPMISAT